MTPGSFRTQGRAHCAAATAESLAAGYAQHHASLQPAPRRELADLRNQSVAGLFRIKKNTQPWVFSSSMRIFIA